MHWALGGAFGIAMAVVGIAGLVLMVREVCNAFKRIGAAPNQLDLTTCEARNTERRKAASPASTSEYDAAVSMMTYESNHFWTTFTAFLIGETLLATLLAEFLRDGHASVLADAVLVSGMALCFPWYVILERARLYVQFRIAQARELEATLGYSLFRAGKQFADGSAIKFADETDAHQFGFASRRWGIRPTTQAIPWIFLTLLGFIGWQAAVLHPSVGPVSATKVVNVQSTLCEGLPQSPLKGN